MDNSAYLYGQPQMTPGMNVPMAPVDQNFSIPGMGGMPQPQMPQQPPPELQHVTDVLQQYIQSKQGQQSSNGMLQQIFANRLQPEMQDVSRSISQTQQAFGAPDLFKAATPQDAMASRYANELSPYTGMLEAQGKMGTNMMNQSGGATGVLINRLMSENPGMNFQQALQQVQTGLRTNTMIDASGNLVPMQGALGTVADLSNAKQTGQNTSDLQYKPQIAGGEALAKTGVELSNAAAIEAQKAAGRGEITPVQNLQKGRGQVSDMIQSLSNSYQALDQAGGITNPEKGALANMRAYAGNTAPGQLMGSMAGTKAQSIRNTIEQSRPLLINAIRQATGMSAKAMDSNAELQFYLKAATDPKLDIKANMAALQKLEQLYGMSAPSLTGAPAPGGIPNPPTPDQINQQMPNAGGSPLGGASHKFDPTTGQLVPLQ